MKALLLGAAALALVQGGGFPELRPTDQRDRGLVMASCVPTEPMPVARLNSTAVARYRMPVIKPDTTRLARMPFARLVPCYQLEWRPTTLPPIVP